MNEQETPTLHPHGLDRTSAAEGGDVQGDSIGNGGRWLGRYQLRHQLGAGAMGAVYEAEDATLGRTVALKVLHRELSERDRQRIQREALALARLSHPNVVQVYEIGRENERTYIAMELVRGRTLDRWQRERPSWRECVRVYLQAGQGLAAAHAVGLVHRDFKPSNCVLGDDARVRVLDFGLARAADSEVESEKRQSGDELLEEGGLPLDARLTRTGAVVGTLAYMPIEQLGGEPASVASDQFSFCVSLHEALYGIRPFAGRGLGELLFSLSQGRIEPAPRGSRVPNRLRRALLRGLSADPKERWPSMDALLAELSRMGLPRRRRTALLVGLGSVLGLALGSTFFTRAKDLCIEPTAALEGVWGPADREAMATAFGSQSVAASLPRVEAQLDRYANAWVEMYESSCRATFVAHRQSEQLFDQRMRCLEHRRNRLRSTIDALLEAETAEVLVDRTVLPFKLPGLEACADLEAVGVEQPLPNDPELRARILALRERLAQVETDYDAGNIERGMAAAIAAVVTARELDHPPVLGEALVSLGRMQNAGASAKDSETTLREAIMVAAGAEDAHTEAEAWIELLFSYVLQGEPKAGLAQELAARSAIEWAHDEVLRGSLLNNMGVLLSENGESERSRDYFERALEVKQRALGPAHLDVGISWYNLGNMLADVERYEPAREAFERARTIFGSTVGEAHPMLQYARSGLCRVEHAQGHAEAAIVLCGEVLAYLEASHRSPMWLSRVGFTLARAQWDAGQHEQARRSAETAKAHADDPSEQERIARWLADPEAPWPPALVPPPEPPATPVDSAASDRGAGTRASSQ